MTEQEKQLLLVTLCSMLPYGVVVKATYKDGEGWKTNDRKLLGVYQHGGQVYLDGVYTSIDNVKPYLRPMSSMTEEEKKEFHHVASLQRNYLGDDIFYTHWQIYDWLNKNYFDYRGLISKGLALEVPKEMYNS